MKEIKGVAAFRGTTTGTARVGPWGLTDMLPNFQPGDIVVCQMMPGMYVDQEGAPSTASAIVCAGSRGCNAARFAWKCRIPCGAGIDPSLIQDGQTITVDGDHGIVRLENQVGKI